MDITKFSEVNGLATWKSDCTYHNCGNVARLIVICLINRLLIIAWKEAFPSKRGRLARLALPEPAARRPAEPRKGLMARRRRQGLSDSRETAPSHLGERYFSFRKPQDRQTWTGKFAAAAAKLVILSRSLVNGERSAVWTAAALKGSAMVRKERKFARLCHSQPQI